MNFTGLDKEALFAVLLRMHYGDLWNLCKAYTRLYRIVCTEHFQEEWTTYNITTSGGVDRDRQGLKHGKSLRVVPTFTEEEHYIQDVLISDVVSYTRTGGHTIGKYKYVDGPSRHGLTVDYVPGKYISYLSYQNDVHDGLNRHYYDDGTIVWEQHAFGVRHGQQFEWYPNGTLKAIMTYRNGKLNGPFVKFYQNGAKQLQTTFEENSQCGDEYHWAPDGTLTSHRII
jgi:antitoxin component YwqK of YwqJK toxin-antitoxin module